VLCSGTTISKTCPPLIVCKEFVSLQADSWLPRRGLRPARCTGTAVSVATGLMEAAAAAAHDGGSGGRILLLTGGPATAGPGQVVPQDLGESIRTHKVRSVKSDNVELSSLEPKRSNLSGPGAGRVVGPGRARPHLLGESTDAAYPQRESRFWVHNLLYKSTAEILLHTPQILSGASEKSPPMVTHIGASPRTRFSLWNNRSVHRAWRLS